MNDDLPRPDPPDGELGRQPAEEGAAAFLAGQSETSNPFRHDTAEWEEWLGGYRRAKDYASRVVEVDRQLRRGRDAP